jgi:hypothetical protein
MTVYCDGDVVAESVSIIDNVEHVWFETPKKGNYSVDVRFITHASGLTELEHFALSYRIACSRITGDFNDDGRIDMSDGMVNFADFCTLAGNWLTGVE